MADEVKQLLLTFAKFEKDGTLPNTIHGNDVSNRDTSDAPLWFAVVCEELVGIENPESKIENFSTRRWTKTAGRIARRAGQHRGKLCDAARPTASTWTPIPR